MATCALNFTFSGAIPGGTPPYKTGLHFECGSAIDMETILGDVDEWFTAASLMRAQLYSLMAPTVISVAVVFAGVAVEYAMDATSEPTGSAPDLPGASLRAIKLGNRPPGGRRGSMFWPGLSGSASGADGLIDSPGCVPNALAATRRG